MNESCGMKPCEWTPLAVDSVEGNSVQMRDECRLCPFTDEPSLCPSPTFIYTKETFRQPQCSLLGRTGSLLKMRLSSAQRRCYVAFLLHAFTELRFKPQSMTKYCAVLFFHRRYLRYIESQPQDLPRETDVQFNCLICLWIASKLHETPSISIRKIQNLAKRTITDHYYTRRDFINAEVKFMKAIGYNLTTGPLISTYVEELLAKSSQKSTEVGINVSLKLCLAILDLLYVCKDEIVKETPIELSGASILVAAYALAMPADECVFPMLTWLELETNISIAKLRGCARKILRCVATGIESTKRAMALLEHIQ